MGAASQMVVDGGKNEESTRMFTELHTSGSLVRPPGLCNLVRKSSCLCYSTTIRNYWKEYCVRGLRGLQLKLYASTRPVQRSKERGEPPVDGRTFPDTYVVQYIMCNIWEFPTIGGPNMDPKIVGLLL